MDEENIYNRPPNLGWGTIVLDRAREAGESSKGAPENRGSRRGSKREE